MINGNVLETFLEFAELICFYLIKMSYILHEDKLWNIYDVFLTGMQLDGTNPLPDAYPQRCTS